MTVNQLVLRLQSLGDKNIAQHSQRFFKTGDGEYGNGDRFLGIRVPVLRKLVKDYRTVHERDILKLLKTDWHEQRLLALLMLVDHFQRGDKDQQKRIVDIYIENTSYINNWDLVDSSAHKILGPWYLTRDRSVLYKLARSKDLWERRIAIMTTLHFIKKNQYEDTLKLSRNLLSDSHDLIHKAVGWMLREVGNRDKESEIRFLNKHYQTMPRTMLRYAIEKFPEKERQAYLKGTI